MADTKREYTPRPAFPPLAERTQPVHQGLLVAAVVKVEPLTELHKLGLPL